MRKRETVIVSAAKDLFVHRDPSLRCTSLRMTCIILGVLGVSAVQSQTDKVGDYLREAERLQQAGRPAEAGQAYSRALALRPTNPRPYVMASRFYEKQNRLQDSLNALKSGLAILPEDFSLQSEAGLICASLHDYVQASGHFEKARAINPASKDNLYNLANAYLKAAGEAYQQGQWDESLARVRKALDTGQQLPRLNYLAGLAYFKKAENKKAIDSLRKAASEEPSDWQICFDFALALAADLQWKEARVHFGKVLELNPNFAPGYMYLGRVLHEMNLSEQSIPLFEKAIRLDPRLPLAHYHLGFALKGLSEYDRARQELLKETEINPTYAPAYFELGLIAAEREGHQEALRYFQLTQQRRPDHARSYYEMAKVLAAAGDYSRAIDAYRDFLKLQPSSSEGHYGLYRALQRAGKKEEAEKELAAYFELAKSQR